MSVFLPDGKIKQSSAKLPQRSVCVLGVILLVAACATQPAKETTSNNTATNALAINGNSDKNIATNESNMICREEAVTGTRFKKRICNTKKGWSAIDKSNKSSSEEFTRTLQDNSALPSDADVSQGIVNSPMN